MVYSSLLISSFFPSTHSFLLHNFFNTTMTHTDIWKAKHRSCFLEYIARQKVDDFFPKFSEKRLIENFTFFFSKIFMFNFSEFNRRVSSGDFFYLYLQYTVFLIYEKIGIFKKSRKYHSKKSLQLKHGFHLALTRRYSFDVER